MAYIYFLKQFHIYLEIIHWDFKNLNGLYHLRKKNVIDILILFDAPNYNSNGLNNNNKHCEHNKGSSS